MPTHRHRDRLRNLEEWRARARKASLPFHQEEPTPEFADEVARILEDVGCLEEVLAWQETNRFSGDSMP